MKTRKNTFWHSETYKPTADALAKLAEDFSKKYPGSSVDISVLSWGDVSPKLSSALAAGAPPEVAMGTFWWESKFADMGVQMILDDLYDYFGDVYDFIKDLCYYKGHYYAFDCTIAEDILIVRKDLWEEYVGMPWPGLKRRLTWSEWLTALDQLTRPEKGLWGIDLAGKTLFFILQDIWMPVGSAGGSWYDDQGRINLDNDIVIKALEFYADQAKHCPPGWEGRDYLDTFSSLATERVAAIYGWPRGIAYIKQYARPEIADQEHFGVILKPAPPNGIDFTQIDDNTWHVFTNSKNPELGKEWVKFINETENYVEWCKTVPLQLLPVRKEANKILREVAAKDFEEWSTWYEVQMYYIEKGVALPPMGFKKLKIDGEYLWDFHLPYVFELHESGIISDMAMDVALRGKAPEDAARDAQKRAVEFLLQKGYKDYVP
ncbi:MAG: extracellular solute-binding protein [Nitrososphaerota archaeon]